MRQKLETAQKTAERDVERYDAALARVLAERAGSVGTQREALGWMVAELESRRDEAHAAWERALVDVLAA